MPLQIKSLTRIFFFSTAPFYAQSSFFFKATRSIIGYSAMAPAGIYIYFFSTRLCYIIADISSEDQYRKPVARL